MTSIIDAHGLTKRYSVRRGMFGGEAAIRAVLNVSFALPPKRTLAIVGESGSGKSTLARMLTMIEAPSEGELRIDGSNPQACTAVERRRLRALVQIVFQNPYGSLNPRQSISAALGEPLLVNTDASAAERRDRALDMLQRVGLRPEHASRYPHMFSGGQRQRIAIARALMLRPKILVLDEPVSALDVSVRAQVLNLLAELQDAFDLTYIFISHDLSVVRHVADEVMVLYFGGVVEHGESRAIFDDPKHPYTQALLSATPMADPARRKKRILLQGELPSPFSPPKGCAFCTRCPLAFERCFGEKPQLEPVGNRTVACFKA